MFARRGDLLPIWHAASHYAEASLPIVIMSGEHYGTGSSRDWAPKGAQLLGARAVLANSFERIQQTNLIGMRVVPLQLPLKWPAKQAQIAPGDTIEIGLDLESLTPRCAIPVTLHRAGTSETIAIVATALIETVQDVRLIQEGGISPLILRQTLAASQRLSSAALERT